MKFASHLAAHITPEWRKQYINYEELKQMLYETVENAPPSEKSDSRELARYFVDADEGFLLNCEKELSKVNTFYSEKIAEAMRKFASLQHDLAALFSIDLIEKPSYYTKHSQSKLPPKKPSTKKQRKLEVAFSEFYLSLVLLQNYQSLNYSGFRKILKKHDKIFSIRNGEIWRRENVDGAIFHVNKETDRLIEDTENIVTIYLEDGNRERAMKRLHIPPIGEHQSLWTTFKLGLLMGTFVTLFFIAMFIVKYLVKFESYFLLIRLYRGTLFITLFLFLCGVNVYGWRSSGINHILIFEINPRKHLGEQHIMEISMMFGICWALSLIGFVYSEKYGIPKFLNPLLSILFMATFLLNPFKLFFHEARSWFLKIIGRIIMAPFFKVGFAEFWVAEQMTSLSPLLLDFAVLIQFYFTNPDWNDDKRLTSQLMAILSNISIYHVLVLCIPPWFRLAQCLRRYHDTEQRFPHLISACKYASMIFISIFSYLHMSTSGSDDSMVISEIYLYLWVLCIVFSCFFMFLWDVKIDWGLLAGSSYKYLREQTLYSSEVYYFIAIAIDFIFRFFWAYSISLPKVKKDRDEVFACLALFLEVIRRFLWNFFRLENEHLNNCGEFRAIRDISIMPLEAVDRDQDTVLRMMDDSEWLTNRREQKDNQQLKIPINNINKTD